MTNKTFFLAYPGKPQKFTEEKIRYLIESIQPDGDDTNFDKWASSCEVGDIWYGCRNMIVVRVKDEAA